MIAAFESLLPVFALILLGLALRARRIVTGEMWRGFELLGYWLFFPALLFTTLLNSDLESVPMSAMMISMGLAWACMAGGLLLFQGWLSRQFALDGPAFSSLFQAATRWNGFIALPVLAGLYGAKGVALAAVVMAVLVPLANFGAVFVLAHNAGGTRPGFGRTAYLVFRNPFIWATLAGLACNLLHIQMWPPILSTLNLLGGAAIGSGLMLIGAGLQLQDAARPSPLVWLGTGLKLLGMPVLVFAWSLVTGLEGNAFVACMVCAAVPTAMSAYVLARQMGGDGKSVAAMITVQTALGFASIPLVIWWAQSVQ